MEKALQVPPDKVRQKLLQATQVIIQLVKEREEWKIKEEELTTLVTQLQQSIRQNGEDDSLVASHTEQAEQENVPPSHEIKAQSFGSSVPGNVSLQSRTHQTSNPVPSGHMSTYEGLSKLLKSRPLSCRLNIPEILTPQKPVQDPLSPKRKPSPDPVSTTAHDGVSLSPLRFSDSSYSSGMQGLQKALQLIDGATVSPTLPSFSQSHKSSTPLKDQVDDEIKEDTGALMMVEGRKVPHGITRKSRVTYAAPRLKKSSKPKIRNYNNKEDL